MSYEVNDRERESVRRSIPLKDWIEKWIPGIAADGRKVAVFPLPNDKGVVVEHQPMLRDIQAALAEYE